MLKKIGIIGLVMSVLVTPASITWGLDFEEGKWEISSTVEMPGMPTQMPPSNVIQCITKQDPVPVKSAEGQQCRITDMKISGNSVTWTMECDQQGSRVKSSGKMTYSGDRFKGTIKTMLGPEAGNMVITSHINGKRIGACD